MASWLAQYSSREKAIVLLALVVMAGLATHAMVIEPYQLRMESVRGELRQQASDLVWMQSVVAKLPAAGLPLNSGENLNEIDGSLANFIDQAVRSQGLSAQLSQMTPVGSDEVRMRYSAVDFNRLIGFIAYINSSGLEVRDIRISSADDPGVVDSSLVFTRP
jgi:type II secretory pathway component PulM